MSDSSNGSGDPVAYTGVPAQDPADPPNPPTSDAPAATSDPSAAPPHQPSKLTRTEQRRRENAKHAKRITHAVYEGMWEAYRDGTRHKKRLAALFGCSWETAHRVVEIGYAQFQWPPLKDRLVQHEAELHRISQAKALEEHRLTHDEWAKTRRDNLMLAGYTKRLLSVLAQRTLTAVQNCVWEKTRKTRDKAGNITEVTVPANGFDLANALARMSMSMEVIGRHESFWLGGPTERRELTVGAAHQVLGLTAEDAQYIIDHDGALPSHLTEEQLIGSSPGGLSGEGGSGPKN